MRRIVASFAFLLMSFFIVSNSAQAFECSPDGIAGGLAGGWQVNNAGGEGFGGWWIDPETGEEYEEEKPTVNVRAGDGSASVASSGQLTIGNVHDEENPNGGTWCAFTLGGYPARVAHADNGWWIFEIGEYSDRNKIEMIRR